MVDIKINDDLRLTDDKFLMIAGPCSVESEEQIISVAKDLRRIGVNVLRGGAFKPRTCPDSFQGLGEKGLKLLAKAREATGMAIITEVMDIEDLPLVEEYADILQIGSRNSQNFSLLKKISKQDKPVLLKRGFGNTVDELIASSKYLSMNGNKKIMFSERGIRTFEQSTRFTLDISAIPVLHEKTEYPVIIDPSHPAGVNRYVEPLALGGTAAGADGLMIEVHPDPSKALSDSAQQLTVPQFRNLYTKVRDINAVLGKTMM
ncbi:MAG: 3-deoxy-7-phosphoheptulonate synthase [Candidatus Thermoplasmatota archaeon]|jgi:3-deoxy-D-arabinoheptulosonate-7-phosphate synthase (EC 2.5.1.54)|uniref:3-deoxy-7-phosphoheptulonate synthase n=1 Tax=Ferroplasma sp. TaxID=2591003 RepID=UPI0026296C34|nr:3-deoxy-7-phosphoheptulonate synthase [Ferroplasma sp.]MCL4311120.1 3-deoxy-7-phosphoheptulonate synthase [Candidatus Thermoplasmatota archaeon]